MQGGKLIAAALGLRKQARLIERNRGLSRQRPKQVGVVFGPQTRRFVQDQQNTLVACSRR